VGALGGVLLAANPPSRTGRVLARGAGLALVAYAASPLLGQLILAAAGRRRRVALRSFIEVDRSLPAVFTFFKDFENLPRVIGSLRSVIDYEDGRSHWEAYTPTGQLMEWDSVVTKYVPNSVIGWESVPNSAVDVRAQLRFIPLTALRTRMEVEVYFSPAAMGFADAIRTLIVAANERRLRAELDHLRFYLETVLPADAPAPPPVAEEPQAAGP
jgi:uncharacterized membrane protein